MPLLVPADQDAKANAGFAVALLTKPVETDHLGFNGVLRPRRRRDNRRHAGNRDRDQRRCYQWLQAHFVSVVD
ncbi:MAG: hypothetical protein JOZ76_09810 [Bradyrhizobium sp.]|nr:hypothetical protein [Bradyrhizobium sp.]